MLDPSFFPSPSPDSVLGHPAVVGADESFTEGFPTNTGSFLMDIQELMLFHLLHQPKNSSSGSQHSPPTAHLVEYTELSPLFSQCSFCCSSAKLGSAKLGSAKLGSALPCAGDMVKE